MNDIVLALLFVINGKLSVLDGFDVRPQESLTACNVRAEQLSNYISKQTNIKYRHKIYCDTPEKIQKIIDNYNSSTGL